MSCKGPQVVNNNVRGPWYSLMVLGNHGNDAWYCMYEAYIEARDSTWRDMKRSVLV